MQKNTPLGRKNQAALIEGITNQLKTLTDTELRDLLEYIRMLNSHRRRPEEL